MSERHDFPWARSLVLALFLALLASIAWSQTEISPDDLRESLERLRIEEFERSSAPATSRVNRSRTDVAEVAGTGGNETLVDQVIAKTKTITVDCTKKKTLEKALRNNAEELIIEVRGICEEDVEIRRDRVTLRGENSAFDGIRATADSDDPRQSVLRIRDARRIRLENLSIEGSSWDGIRLINSFDGIDLSNVEVRGNAVRGITAIDSAVTITDAVVIDNGDSTTGGGSGIYAFGSSIVVCERCRLLDNPTVGAGTAIIADSAQVFVEDSELVGRNGVASIAAGQIEVENSMVSANTAVVALDGARASVEGSDLEGRILVADKAQVTLVTSQFTGTAGSLMVDDSYLAFIGTDFDGTLSILDFAKARVSSGTLGGVSCIDAGQAVCSVGATIGSSNCGACSTP